jgi:hypothetical protein
MPTYCSYSSKVPGTDNFEAYSTSCYSETKDASSERQMRVLTEAPLGGPAIKPNSRHLNATLNFTLRPGGASSVLGYWTFGSLCLMGARPPTPQPGQGCTIRSGMHNQALRLSLACRATGALTHRWLQTGARTTSHEPRTVSVLQLVLAMLLLLR